MPIYPRSYVLAAFERALALDPCREKAAAAVTRALGLPIETVKEVADAGR